MATASRQVRKTRRLKRERTLAFRMYNIAVSQRDQARLVASALEKELQVKEAKPALTITKIEEPMEGILETT